jgi:hypothetical protein
MLNQSSSTSIERGGVSASIKVRRNFHMYRAGGKQDTSAL